MKPLKIQKQRYLSWTKTAVVKLENKIVHNILNYPASEPTLLKT